MPTTDELIGVVALLALIAGAAFAWCVFFAVMAS